MGRTVLRGGRIFDGSGSPIADGDLVIEDGQIVEIGAGLDGDEQVDVSGCTLLPGLFDCHVHVTSSGVDFLGRLQRPFSYQFYEAARTSRPRSTAASRRSGTRAAPISASSARWRTA